MQASGTRKARLDELIDQVRQPRRPRAVDRIYVAGEIKWDLEPARRASGVPLESGFESLETTARDVGA
jgi:LDH2 family malate/lactate/ureidoglycolate dehydrogenase